MIAAPTIFRPERGRSEAIQYTLIASMITVSCLAVMASIGIKLLAHWTTTSASS
jgi:Flp pilus assembly pilin Flp